MIFRLMFSFLIHPLTGFVSTGRKSIYSSILVQFWDTGTLHSNFYAIPMSQTEILYQKMYLTIKVTCYLPIQVCY